MATISDIEAFEKSGDNNVNALLGDGLASWNYQSQGNVLYYTFDSMPGLYGESVTNVQVFNAVQESAAEDILAYAASVTGITFQETSNSSLVDIGFYYADLDGATTSGLTESSYSYSYIGETVTDYDAQAVIYLDNNEFSSFNQTPLAGNQGYETLLHEMGHALGLKHPFEGTYQLPVSLDSTNYTVMSYTDAGELKSEYQSIDLDALWWIYGGDGLEGTYGINSTMGPTLSRDDVTPSTPQAMIYLYESGTFALGSSAEVYGTVGQEAVLIESTANNVTVDQNVEQVELSGSSGEYTFLQAGNQLQVFFSGVTAATIAVSTDRTGLAFSDGTAQVMLAGAEMTIGGEAVSSTTAGSLSNPNLDGSSLSRAGTVIEETDSQAGVYMVADGSFILGIASEVRGTTGAETVLLHSGVSNVYVDQNVERVDMAGAIQEFEFQQSGNQILVYQDGQLSVRLGVQSDGTDLAFLDGLAEVSLSGIQMSLGGTVLSATTPGSITPASMNTAQTSGISAYIADDVVLMGQLDATGSDQAVVVNV